MAQRRKRSAAKKSGLNGFSQRLLPWFDEVQRDLPWRRTRDPWAIWVSEIMLQQTRVEAVREPFERFLNLYPEAGSFAEASDDEVVVAWRGLGYYRRARLLRDGARRVAEHHGGKVPNTIDELRDLPGVGPYTLGAVASIAFGHPEPAVDGNVERVVSRHRGLAAAIGTGPARRAIREIVLGWLDQNRAGDFNQAMMELGATVCTPTSPNCGECPVKSDCIALRENRTDELPVKKAPRKAVEVSSRTVLVTDKSDQPRVLGYRVPTDQPNGGQIELPGPGVLVDCDPDDLADAIEQRFGARLTVGEPIASVRHAITHHRITMHGHGGQLHKKGSLQWFSLGEDVPWTTPSRKVFAKASGQRLDKRTSKPDTHDA